MVLKNVDTVNYDRPNLTGTNPKISKKLLPVRTGLVAKSITSLEMFRYSMATSCTCTLLAVHGCSACLKMGFQAFSFLCTFVPGSEKTIERTFAPVELSFHGTFAPWNFRSCGTFAPRERRFQELSFRGTFAPMELSFLGS